MQVHIRLVLAIVREEAPVGKYKLEAVIQKAILVEGEDKPRERLVLWLYLL